MRPCGWASLRYIRIDRALVKRVRIKDLGRDILRAFLLVRWDELWLLALLLKQDQVDIELNFLLSICDVVLEEFERERLLI